jgi:hypothetical protein
MKNLVFTPPKSGRYEITFRGFDRSGRRARATKILSVLPEPVLAIPRLSIDGKPFSPELTVTRGQTLAVSHESTGPVAKAEWDINGEKVSAASLSRLLEEVGEQSITLSVESTVGPGGEVTHSTSQPIVFQVVAQPVTAVVDITINGESIESVDAVYAGDVLQLHSRSTGPVKSAVWTINDKDVAGDTVQWPITDAGELKISLKVSDPEFGQADVSDTVSLVARNRPAIWKLWAIGIFEISLLAFLTWLLTGNRARESLLLVEGGGMIHARKYFSRFRKTSTIPMKKIFPGNKYWRDKQDHEAIVISRNAVSRGPAAKLACTFASRGGDVSFSQDTGKPPTNIEGYYLLEDNRDAESPQQIELTLRTQNRSFRDNVLLAVIAAVLAGAFVYFYQTLPL